MKTFEKENRLYRLWLDNSLSWHKIDIFHVFLYSYAIKSNLCHFSNLNSKGVFVVGIFRYWYIFSAFSFVETLF